MESKCAKMILGIYDHYLRGVEKPEVKSWTLVDISSTSAVYKNMKSKTYVFAYRGMISPEDMKVVPTLVSNKVSTTSRYQKDREFTKKNQPPQGYRRIATGHSLGGAMVDQILADGLADSGISFNPAIELNKLDNKGNRRLYNRNDFLYKLIGMYASNVETINNDFFSRISAGVNFLNIALSYYTHNLSQFINKEKEKIEKPNEEEPKEVDKERETRLDPKSYVIQSVVLNKSRFPTLESAKEWASQHHYRTAIHDETINEYRFRQINPEIFKSGIYEARTVELKGIGYLVVAYKL